MGSITCVGLRAVCACLVVYYASSTYDWLKSNAPASLGLPLEIRGLQQCRGDARGCPDEVDGLSWLVYDGPEALELPAKDDAE
jgi:hypothetical protein